MSSNGKVRSPFGAKLRAELDRQEISIRELGRRIDPKSPEVARRNLSRWITGGTRPTKGSRVLVAVTLGLEPTHFDEDEEEEDADVLAIVHELMRRVDARVDKRLGVEA